MVPRNVLRQADEALYQAKRSGRNSIWVFDSVTEILPLPSRQVAHSR